MMTTIKHTPKTQNGRPGLNRQNDVERELSSKRGPLINNVPVILWTGKYHIYIYIRVKNWSNFWGVLSVFGKSQIVCRGGKICFCSLSGCQKQGFDLKVHFLLFVVFMLEKENEEKMPKMEMDNEKAEKQFFGRFRTKCFFYGIYMQTLFAFGR